MHMKHTHTCTRTQTIERAPAQSLVQQHTPSRCNLWCGSTCSTRWPRCTRPSKTDRQLMLVMSIMDVKGRTMTLSVSLSAGRSQPLPPSPQPPNSRWFGANFIWILKIANEKAMRRLIKPAKAASALCSC